MMMSLFRQGQPAQQLDHLACIETAVDDDAVKMILHARSQSQTVLVGLEGGQAIIKPMETGDDRLSFESLYDTCVSLREYRKMQGLNVKSPAEFPPQLYETEILIPEVNMVPRVRFRFPAKGTEDARETIKQLVNRPDFREQLVRRFIIQMIESHDVDLLIRGPEAIADVAPEGPAWEFLDDVT